ncbi:alpha/beta hydrolase family protein [Paractinoplanes lichenicola]|uniref:Alpha/beta hydrolase n=1 Tax=Paractinoplanes lichenicola TaxID=2802976 RepID=A0ABS1W4A1_9ACTN|nr:alpha/beta fold hydrolase [Actinoplanes lichenicola]MBL7261553.1 alpha/beta hydrolase [Actinoplanes lichenicola]
MSVLTVAVTAASLLVAPTVTLELPAPTGPYEVGVVNRHLVDRSRADPWVPERRRELMVSLWYPALRGTGPAARYVTPEESALILEAQNVTGVPSEILSTTVTHSRAGAVPLPHQNRRPLVVLSPGFTLPRSSLTGLAEDLASRGYVVAGIDHTYESAAVTFPDGRIAECLMCGRADGPKVTASRVRDVQFVLDSLRGGYDARRVAMVGHSLGGSAASAAMVADPRIDVGVNLDGTVQVDLPARGLDRPFVLIGNAKHGVPGDDKTWTDAWSRLTGWKRWLSVTGTTHLSFTDFAPLGDQAGLPIQPLGGTRSMQITRAYVAATLDKHLRAAPGPLPRYPEAVFQNPVNR